ncbi:hypothetical protein IEQ34_009395 [Dendrobium chrysotoxum]|uniref:Uncharacterized protein n=1 Tax=Dendrobium chrysotoxum TaxID=161865 RepID=A0AAV7GJ11_DENCH|nr:hypothetical protein IEQ34_009395 [Dendrobium chrysotoxum]
MLPNTNTKCPFFLFCCCFVFVLLHTISFACQNTEREALLRFKSTLHDPSCRLSSWQGDNCCQWRHITCRQGISGHVISLNLRNPKSSYDPPLDWKQSALSGEISPSLLSLTQLQHLDLSLNYFNGTPMPYFLGSLKNLMYLNLSNAGFSGVIPHQLGNLDRLVVLDLSALYGEQWVRAGDLGWLSGLSSLKYLDLSAANLTSVKNWMEAIILMPSIEEVRLLECLLVEIPGYVPNLNMSSLSVLEIDYNSFDSILPPWFWALGGLTYLSCVGCGFYGSMIDSIHMSVKLVDEGGKTSIFSSGLLARTNLCYLIYMDLSHNSIEGDIAEFFNIVTGCKLGSSLQTLRLGTNRMNGTLSERVGKMTALGYLDLSNNFLFGPMPKEMGELKHLQTLDLSNNSIMGHLPVEIGELLSLRFLDISSNRLVGEITERHFQKMDQLQELFLFNNHFIMTVNDAWVPRFQLSYVGLNSCKLGPKFPAWLQWQENVSLLVLSNTSIADILPTWFWKLSSNVITLDLSHNRLTGRLLQSLEFMSKLSTLDLSYNQFTGEIPSILPTRLQRLHLSYNLLSGTLPSKFQASSLAFLLLSNNKLHGSFPTTICNLISLKVLDLSNNNLSDSLPDCWRTESQLQILNLGRNQLSGALPPSIGSLSQLMSFHVNNNYLSGELPQSLQRCSALEILDIGQNNFSGIIPDWLAEGLPRLMILRLRSNMFCGSIPEFAKLDCLQILDLAYNKLAGSIPSTFGNFSLMITADIEGLKCVFGYNGNDYAMPFFGTDVYALSYIETISIVTKRVDREYSKILSLLRSIDMSSNDLSGHIPEEITALAALQNLNLSSNHLTGVIPEKLGNMQSLESLDLSMNNISGTIPQSLSSLTSMSSLNLSYNNLSGKIPSGNQLQTLDDPSIYKGNANLCGLPVSKDCSSSSFSGKSSGADDESNEHDHQHFWVYFSSVLGFVIGAWAVFGILFYKTSWRVAYFKFAEDICDWIFLVVTGNSFNGS